MKKELSNKVLHEINADLVEYKSGNKSKFMSLEDAKKAVMTKEREALRDYHKEAVEKAKKAREAWEKKNGKKAGGYMKDLYKRMKEENFEIVIDEEYD